MSKGPGTPADDFSGLPGPHRWQKRNAQLWAMVGSPRACAIVHVFASCVRARKFFHDMGLTTVDSSFIITSPMREGGLGDESKPTTQTTRDPY